MTVATEYFNYQQAGVNYPLYNKGESPAIDSLQHYLLKRYGGVDLGSFGVRKIVGGSSWSTHSFGSAWDWRYMNGDQTGLVGRSRLLNEVLPFLINHSDELGIQYIGDYVGCRVWKADRATDPNGGWKIQDKSSQMGQPWAGWLHIEIHPSKWHDGRSVEDKLGVTGFPPFNPGLGEFSLYPFASKPTIQLGSKGDLVKYFQGVLLKTGQIIKVDGDFGNITKENARWYQALKKLTVDGVVGPKTWAQIDIDAKN